MIFNKVYVWIDLLGARGMHFMLKHLEGNRTLINYKKNPVILALTSKMFFHQERGKRTKNMQTVSIRVKWLSMLLVCQSGLLKAMVYSLSKI